MRNGTPLQRLRDRQRVSVPPERVASLSAAKTEAAVEAVAGVSALVSGVQSDLALVRTDLTAAQDAILELQPEP